MSESTVSAFRHAYLMKGPMCGFTHDFVFYQNVGWHFIIQFHDFFHHTEYHSGLNLLLGNDSHLINVIFQTFRHGN